MALNDLFEILHVVTGLTREELVEAATSPEKETAAMVKISRNAAIKAGRIDLINRETCTDEI